MDSKLVITAIIVLIVGIVIGYGIASATVSGKVQTVTTTVTQTTGGAQTVTTTITQTVAPGVEKLNEKNVYSLSWDQIEQLAKKEGQVVWYGFGSTYERDFFTELCQNFTAETGIKCTYVHGSWFDTVQKIISEKEAGKETGDIDVVLAWSKPFAMAYEAGAVWDVNLAEIIPNSKGIPFVARYFHDMYPTNGRHLPILAWWVGFLYRKDLYKYPDDLPKSFDELLDWVKKHPGQFTYCDPNKGGSGHTFLIGLAEWFYGYDKFAFVKFTEEHAKEIFYSKGKYGMNFWEYLNELEKYMYQPGNYPQGNKATIELFEAGEVTLEPMWISITMQEVESGRLDPNWVGMYIPEPTMPGPFDGVFIPFNAPHKAAALVFINWLLSNKVQALIPQKIGAYPAVTEAWKDVPDEVKKQPWWPINPPYNDLIKWREFGPLWFRHADYMFWMMKTWVDEVARK